MGHSDAHFWWRRTSLLDRWRIHFCLQAFLSPHLELTRYTHFSLLPCSRWHVLYFEARPLALLRCVGRVMNSGPSLDLPAKTVACPPLPSRESQNAVRGLIANPPSRQTHHIRPPHSTH